MSHRPLISLFTLLIAPALFAAELQTIPITHPHDSIIHGWYADDLAGEKLDRTGTTDVSAALNSALKKLFDTGGGTLYLPAGKYRLDHPVFIRPGTTLRGDFVTPGFNKVDPTKNTIICAYYGREMDALAPPLFFLDGSSLIDGLVIWYPEQKVDHIVPYAPTIRHHKKLSKTALNGSSRNLFLVNAYTGIQLGKKKGATCIHLMKNIYGTPLGDGIEVWRDADIPRILDIDFNPDYWPAAELDHSPIDREKLKTHLFEKASGITYHRCDGSELANITIRGYNKGFQLNDGHLINDDIWLDNEGHYINFSITDCYDAVWISNIKNHGTQFYNCTLEGKRSAVFVENPMHGKECAMFMGCELRGGQAAVLQHWEAEKNDLFSLMFSACTFKSPIEWTGGNLSIVDCDFDFEGQHLFIGKDTAHAVIADSRFKGPRTIDNQAGDKVKISASRDPYIKPPKYTYDVNKISTYKPPSIESVILHPEKGTSDDTARIQFAIDGLSKSGGGYIVLSPGFYALKSSLVVRRNVELRGPVQAWQHSTFHSYYAEKGTPKGALFFVEHGHNEVDTATITLEENAGLDGLFFHYPEQEFDSQTKEVTEEYGWLIRMQGDRSYVKHVTASNPWRFIDLYSHDAKDTYIGYCNGAPLDQGIFVGEAENCMIDNVHFNSWYWNQTYFPNKIVRTVEQKGYKKELDNWMKANTKAFIFAGSRNVDVYGTFIFCSNQGFKLLPGKTSGKGPSGIIINSGCDWSKFGLYMHANDGLVFANMHFIDVGENDPDLNISSIYVAPACADPISLYNLSTWGTSHRALALDGTATSQVNIYNFSNQLYYPQTNNINGGHVRIINSIRNISEPTTLDMGPDASFMMRANIAPAGLIVTPSRIKKDLEDTSADFLNTSSRRGVSRSYSFP
ncbi:glycosyl hydrolase family 28-related protein [Pontiella sulfatireligans]|uniref:Rhamnogalacturonase A/B/Epimerase-like pectate lyase domain-containing protein n=1 Tax=Pontiella sulfatireligans TaxID=2750658 RepID=A0A6C2UTL8_9BACT|nr:glycosyl hydrolase family 28-related protein [Pontiella sulfatireligans]VGO23509.1 hypothetical protein SCARR_05616 [Pontiella sulfatireligans]